MGRTKTCKCENDMRVHCALMKANLHYLCAIIYQLLARNIRLQLEALLSLRQTHLIIQATQSVFVPCNAID